MMSELTERWAACLEKPQAYRRAVEGLEGKIGAFLEFRVPDAKPVSGDSELPETGLRGIPFAVKNNIAVKGWKLSCGSKMLSGLIAPYTATAVERLESQGAVMVGTTNLDE